MKRHATFLICGMMLCLAAGQQASALESTNVGTQVATSNHDRTAPIHDRAAAIRSLSATFGPGASVAFDERGRMNITGIKNAPTFRAVVNPRLGAAAIVQPDMRKVSADVFASIRGTLWSNRRLAILETNVESSRYGHVAFSTITLDGYPVIDQILRVDASETGDLKSVRVSLSADFTGFAVSGETRLIRLQDAVRTIREHSRARHPGLICPDQAQRVWFRDETGLLAPGARMLLKSADHGSLFEAVVDMRTGRLVRFADLARR